MLLFSLEEAQLQLRVGGIKMVRRPQGTGSQIAKPGANSPQGRPAQSLPARIAATPAAAPGVTRSPARPSIPLLLPQLLHPERQLWCRGPGSGGDEGQQTGGPGLGAGCHFFPW